MDDVPAPRGDGVAGIGDAAGDEEADDLRHADDGREGQDEDQAFRAVVLDERGERVALCEVARTELGDAAGVEVLGRSACVPPDRRGHDLHVVSGDDGAPAQVEVLAEGVGAPVEAAELVEDASTHHHAGRRDEQDAVTLVVLALVELPGIEPIVDTAGQVDRRTDGLESAGLVEPAKLRPDDREPLVSDERGDELRHGIRLQLEVVVDEQDQVVVSRRSGGSEVAGDQRIEGEIDRTCEAEIPVGEQDAIRAEQVHEQRLRAVGARVVDGQQLDVGIGLGGERTQAAAQEPGPVAGDQEGDDARARRQHGGGTPSAVWSRGRPLGSLGTGVRSGVATRVVDGGVGAVGARSGDGR